MECMDFIILKVNGTDVSSSTHADAVREFLAAEEPIVVEVIRRVSNNKQTPTSSEEHSEPRSCSSTTSSICNENDQKDLLQLNNVDNDLEISTCFNIESPIYTNKSIIHREETAATPTNASLRAHQTIQYLDINEDEIHVEEFDDDDDDDENEAEILYQNGCIVNKCIGCEYCGQISEQLDNSAAATIIDGGDVELENNDRKRNLETVSRSVQTHLTALNWMDEIEDCLYHINLEEVMARKSSSEGSSMSDAGIVVTNMENHDTTKDFHEFTADTSSMWYQQYASSCEQIKTPENDNIDGAASAGIVILHESGSADELLPENKQENILVKSPTNSFIRTQLQSINEQIAELDNRMHKIHIVNTKKTTKLLSGFESSEDCEHIYETIQESEIEPIYSSPYDPDSEIIVQRRLTSVSVDKKKRSKCKSISTGSSNSGNSGDGMVQLPALSRVDGGDGDSSSAYNTGTGGSSNSNHHTSQQQAGTALTFKLGCNHTNRSILQLCSPSHYRYDNLMPKVSSNRILKGRTNGLGNGMVMHNSKSLPSAASPQMPADTMYTNMANLHQTILLQQQLFRQALNQQRQTPFFREAVRSNTSSTFPGAAAQSSNQQTHNEHMTTTRQHENNRSTSNTQQRSDKDNNASLKMEWKVKRRQNGTRYIARRPIRNRILRNRTKEIIEERAAEFTTEDDTCSEIKIGRYWTKEERKRQILERERKIRNQLETNNKIENSKNCGKCVKCSHHRVCDPTSTSPDVTTHCGGNNSSSLYCTRALPITGFPTATTSASFNGTIPSVNQSGGGSSSTCTIRNKSTDKKSIRKKSHKDSTITDDFKTVQDMIVNGGQRATNSSAGKMIGLLSVTTV